MALNNYVLRGPSVVILDDNRDPYVSWAHHLQRTGRGGVDLVAAVGTPIYARTSGTMVAVPADGSAGNSSRFYHDDNPGWKDVFSHLSSYRTPRNPQGLSGFHYNSGDIVAYTGNSGNVTQHLHWHLLDPGNVRRNPWDYFSSSSTAGGGTTPLPIPELEHDVPFIIVNLADPGNNALYILGQNGSWVTIANTTDLGLLQRYLDAVKNVAVLDSLNGAQITTIRRYLKQINDIAGD